MKRYTWKFIKRGGLVLDVIGFTNSEADAFGVRNGFDFWEISR